MTPTQQFYVSIVTLVMAGVVTPLIAIVSGVLAKKSAGKADVASGKAEVASGKAEVAVEKAEQSAKRLVLIEGALFELGKRVDGQLEALVAATGAQQRAEGKAEGRSERRVEEREERQEQERPAHASALLDQTTIIADNTTKLAESIEAKEDGTPERKNPFLPPEYPR